MSEPELHSEEKLELVPGAYLKCMRKKKDINNGSITKYAICKSNNGAKGVMAQHFFIKKDGLSPSSSLELESKCRSGCSYEPVSIDVLIKEGGLDKDKLEEIRTHLVSSRDRLKTQLKDISDDKDLASIVVSKSVGIDEELASYLLSKDAKDREESDNEDDDKPSEQHDAIAFKAKSAVQKLKLMQWNQKWLTEGKCKAIIETIHKIDPDIVIMQEIKGISGENAVKHIKEELNKLNEKKKKNNKRWEYHVTEKVNKGFTESYACLYRSDTVGILLQSKVLFRNGFYFDKDSNIYENEWKLLARNNEIEKKYNELLDEELTLGKVKVNMEKVMEYFKNCKDDCKNSKWFQRVKDVTEGSEIVGFDYCPVIFTFEVNGKPFHIIGIHGSTGDKKWPPKSKTSIKIPEQNIVEMMYLQHFCTEAVKNGEFTVLLGDFNTQEEANCHVGLWDRNWNIPCLVENEEEVLREVREEFLNRFHRATDASIPTNVYPFLAGQTSYPKHNDDIWIPSGMEESNGWYYKEGKVLEIPVQVLLAWDKAATEYFKSNDNCNRKKSDASKINAELSQIWSDHRPLIACIKYKKPADKKTAGGGSETKKKPECDSDEYDSDSDKAKLKSKHPN